ncbi:MAG: hypothetical protein JO007_21645 [Alphaproteobacteria bacterium]|nr:hypothetical protein [Alphaproteobacteria bacterium]
MIESIDIGDATDRGDRKAKQAGSRLSEMFVVASRFRSVIAGLSAIANPLRKALATAISSPPLPVAQSSERYPLSTLSDRLLCARLSKYIVALVWSAAISRALNGLYFARSVVAIADLAQRTTLLLEPFVVTSFARLLLFRALERFGV